MDLAMRHLWVQGLVLLLPVCSLPAEDRAGGERAPVGAPAEDLFDVSGELRSIDSRCLPEAQRAGASRMLDRWLDGLLVAAARRENAAWSAVSSIEEWEPFRDRRLDLLRKSLGAPPEGREPPRVRVTGRLSGDGYRVENIVFESRPHLWVTANLYLPGEPRGRMPAIVVAHSHHRPKTQGELQDMGVTWARAGCAVIVPDMLGHGERREHPFRGADDWTAAFRPSRQDYYFRYNLGLQLGLVGESLMGWMVQDLVRSIDLLVSRSDVDRERIVLIGAVAGGGDPAGVTAALDSRVTAVAPFNFGGPQPDYAIPEDLEDFYWFGVPYWESTRSLRLGARDGFAHWVIVASVAPRRLVYSHEFRWDRERDPAWPRVRRVFELYGREDHLGWTAGRGELRGRPPQSTHCTNVGRIHREGLHPWLERWFAIAVPAESSDRRPADELRCLTPGLETELGSTRAHAVARDEGVRQITRLRVELAQLTPAEQRKRLRERWRRALGAVDPQGEPLAVARSIEMRGGLRVERLSLTTERGILVPLLIISRSDRERAGAPLVLALARGGKVELLRQLDRGIGELLAAGVTVSIPDLRGTGETSPGSASGQRSRATSLSCRALLIGETLLGARLRDLRSVLRYLRRPGAARPARIALWGVSLAPANERGRDVGAPLRIDDPPLQGDPLAPLLVMLAALFEDDLSAVCADGLLATWLSALETPFLHLPHDVVVPGALAAGDVADVLASSARLPVRCRGFIDALNRPMGTEQLRSAMAPALQAYERVGGKLDLSVERSEGRGRSDAQWLIRTLAPPGDAKGD